MPVSQIKVFRFVAVSLFVGGLLLADLRLVVCRLLVGAVGCGC